MVPLPMAQDCRCLQCHNCAVAEPISGYPEGRNALPKVNISLSIPIHTLLRVKRCHSSNKYYGEMPPKSNHPTEKGQSPKSRNWHTVIGKMVSWQLASATMTNGQALLLPNDMKKLTSVIAWILRRQEFWHWSAGVSWRPPIKIFQFGKNRFVDFLEESAA